ncbi:hypothetical protein [Streptomyces telluris]|uniref:Uncharacterized protein n=1 Tax=Streptomyces telluris TaxID=2720021 RepID=A0A9X2LLW7_9ACTN|nr:hypothetical protein [Streptomyces telluris]MCQ8773734.1 hypothetical protein [Streptomyces telluris]NJP78912.1 hypothetical protein [Streptomyces telluris]
MIELSSRQGSPARDHGRGVFAAVLPVALVGVLLAVAGCSGSSSGDKVPQPSAFPEMTSAASHALPIDPYLLTHDQADRLESAQRTLVERCMRRFGVAYRPAAPATPFRPKTRTQYRYGVTDPSAAARYGFAPPGSPRVPPAPPAPPPSLSAEAGIVLAGTDDPKVKPGSAAAKGGQRVNGRTVPAGGCTGEARSALRADNAEAGGDAPVADRINSGSFERSQRDPRVVRVFAQWASCMKKRGFASYDDPLKAGADAAWRTPEPSAEERETAAADAWCKGEHNVVGVWFAVDAAYQRQEIDRNAEALSAVKAELAARQELAGAALGTLPPRP